IEVILIILITKTSQMKKNKMLSSLSELGNNKKIMYEIVDETDDFIIVYKKNGIAVQATDNEQLDLEKIFTEKYGVVYVLNRIDQPVSGLVVFDKNKHFAELFTEKIKEREVKKTYLAIVSGEPEKEKTMLKHYIKKLHSRAMTADEPIDEAYK